MKRDGALDALKGMAIVLVVMGHVMAGCFPKGGADASYLFSLVYSFHMPLFLFISGLLCAGGGGKRTIIAFVWHRFLTLLVPWLVANVMIRFFYSGLEWVHGPNPFANGPTGYWYLQVLFIFSTSFGLLTAMTNRICRTSWRVVIEIALILVCWLLFVHYERWYYRLQFSVSPLFGVFEYWQVRQRLIWFALGFFIARYDLWRYVVNRAAHALSILIFIPIVGSGAKEIVLYGGGLSGIVACLNVFKNKDFSGGKLFGCCKYVGMYTMQIYVLHYLFLPSFPEFGRWIGIGNAAYGRVSTIVFQWMFSGMISAFVIVMCIVLAKMIGTSRIANRLLFGGR